MNGVDPNLTTKFTQIQEELNKMNYILEGDDEVLTDYIKKQKFTYSTEESFYSMVKILSKYVKVKLRISYNMLKYIFTGGKFYASKDIFSPSTATKKMIILLLDKNNSLGVFSKLALVHESIKIGSVIQYIEALTKQNYEVVLLKTNKEGADLSQLLEVFWDEIIIKKVLAKEIAIFAQKSSSVALIKLMNKFNDEFKKRITKIILLQSGHNCLYEILPTDLRIDFERKATNYILSTESAGVLLYSATESVE